MALRVARHDVSLAASAAEVSAREPRRVQKGGRVRGRGVICEVPPLIAVIALDRAHLCAGAQVSAYRDVSFANAAAAAASERRARRLHRPHASSNSASGGGA